MIDIANGPLVSVLIPTYNRAYCLARAIESVLCQTYKNIECIIVDDGSTDETPALVKKYGNRIRYIHQTNAGVSAARNRGIREARGEWLAFLDSDDEWLPEKLTVQVTAVLDNPTLVAHTVNCRYTAELDDGPSSFATSGFPKMSPEGILTHPFPCQVRYSALARVQSILCRRESAIKAGLFNEELSLYEDYFFMCRLALLGPWGYTWRELAVIHRAGPEHLSKDRFSDPLAMYESLRRVYEDLLNMDGLKKQDIEFLHIYLAKTYFTLGMEFLRNNRLPEGRGILLESIRINKTLKTFLALIISSLPGQLPVMVSRFL